jgi:hypothetical protein
MDQEEFDRRATAAGSEHAALIRRDLAQVVADLEAADATLRGETKVYREGHSSRSRERADEPAGSLSRLPL